MTRTITANVYMTLDGYGEFPEYYGSNYAPAEPDEMWKLLWSDRYDSVDTVIFGRRSFEGHVRVHRLEARKPDDPWYMFDYSRYLDRVQKVVLSHSLKETDWQNTRFLSGPLEEIVAQLKSEPGKNIMVDGGPTLVNEFLEKGLADEYRMAIWPVVYGRGPSYWPKLQNQRTLRLLSAKTMPFGELVLHYQAVR